MNRFSINFMSNINENNTIPKHKFFNKDMNYYICSFGGCGSTVLFNYMSNFGNVYHIHDRFPPSKLTYIGNENVINENIYSEWFNSIEIPEDKLKNYKVIYIYRNPIEVIYSRFAQSKGPNIPHLQHIKCDNNGNINLFDVLQTKKDLYKIEEFYDNYTIPFERNYIIFCLRYELFWNNISLFNKIIDIPDIKELYPIKQERPKNYQYIKELGFIYGSLINKMNRMRFIELSYPIYDSKDN